jgi:hypothetical protein
MVMATQKKGLRILRNPFLSPHDNDPWLPPIKKQGFFRSAKRIG